MKIKSRVNGIIIEGTQSTAEVLRLGNGKYAQAISDSAVEADDDDSNYEDDSFEDDAALEPPAKKETPKKPAAKKTPAKKTAAKKNTSQSKSAKPDDEEVAKVKAEAAAAGIKLDDSQIEGGNIHDMGDASDDGIEKL